MGGGVAGLVMLNPVPLIAGVLEAIGMGAEPLFNARRSKFSDVFAAIWPSENVEPEMIGVCCAPLTSSN